MSNFQVKRKAGSDLTEGNASKKIQVSTTNDEMLSLTNYSLITKNNQLVKKVICIDNKTGRISLAETNSTASSFSLLSSSSSSSSSPSLSSSSMVSARTPKCIEPLIWECLLFPMLGMKEIYQIKGTSSFFLKRWNSFVLKNKIHVPNDVANLDIAANLINTLCQEKQYTREEPLFVELGPGVHVINSQWTSTFSNDTYPKSLLLPQSNITIIGAGSDKTEVRGGFVVEGTSGNRFESMNVTSPCSMGLYVKGANSQASAADCTFTHSAICGLYGTFGAQVEITRCEFAWCVKTGAFGMHEGTLIKSTDCVFHHNNDEGLFLYGSAECDLYGNLTESYSNKSNGLMAIDNGVINVHLPESLVIAHDNLGHDIINSDTLVSDTIGIINYCCLCNSCVARTHGIDVHIWDRVVFPLLGWKEIYKMRSTSKFILSYWKKFVMTDRIRVPIDAKTLDDARELINTICQEKVHTQQEPLVVEIGPGLHVINNYWASNDGTTYLQTMSIPHNHISIIGSGSDLTTIRGGFLVENNTGILFQGLNVTSPNGMGLYISGKLLLQFNILICPSHDLTLFFV
jgi:hypothetical protein